MPEAPENLGWWNALVIAFGIPVKIQAILIRVAWVVLVSGVILRACGWLAWMGLASPFVFASDYAKSQHAQEVAAAITIGQELGKAVDARCHERDPNKRSQLTNYINYLQGEYVAATQTKYPENCQ